MNTLVGASQVTITPPGKTLFSELDEEFIAVRGELFLRCLLVRNGAVQVTLLVFDLIGFNNDFVRRIKARLQEGFGLPPDHVMVVTTQNHAGPRSMWVSGQTGTDDRAKAYLDFLEVRLDEVVASAATRMSPARIGFGAGAVEGIAGNRRPFSRDGRTKMIWYRPDPAEIVDWGVENPAVEVARIDAENGSPLAVLFHFTCHPNVLWTTRAIHPDFPGVACERIRAALGAGVVPIFINGFCGDIDPFKYMNVPPASFVKAAGALLPENRDKAELCFGESERFGRMLGDEAARIAGSVTCSDPVLRPAALVRQVQGIVRAAEQRVYDRSETIEVQALRLSDGFALLGVPLEPFLQVELDIERQSPLPHMFCVQGANGYQGYLPPASEYPRGGYGTGPGACNFEPGTDQRVIEAAVEMLKECGNAV